MLIDSVKLLDGFIDDGVIETGTSLPSAVGAKQGQLFYLRSGDKGLYSFNGSEWEKPSGGGGDGGGGDDSYSWMGGEPSDKKQRLGLTNDSSYFGKSVASGTTEMLYKNESETGVTIIKNLIICNPNVANALLTLCINSDTSSVLGKAIFYRAFVKAGKTIVIDLSSVLEPGQGIYATVYTDVTEVPTALSISTIGVELDTAAAVQLAMQMISTTWEPIYSTPADKNALMYQMLAVNGSTTDTKLSFQIVPDGGSIDPKNILLSEIVLTASETLMFTTVIPIPAGFTLYAKADKAASINMTLDGTEK